MTNETELRDRIADQIMPASVREIDEATGRAAVAVAGKIIDDLGLTVEYEQSWFVGLRDENGKLIKDAKAKRVVGKWEKQ